MPSWMEWIIGIGAALGAFIFLMKALRTLVKVGARIDIAIPLMKAWVDAYEDSPRAFNVLAEIAAQFHTDSGTTLRDVINRLETGALVLTQNAAVSAELAAQDRVVMQRLVVVTDHLTAKLGVAVETVDRIETATTTAAVVTAAGVAVKDDAAAKPPESP